MSKYNPPILRFFACDHLPPPLQAVASPFAALPGDPDL